MRAHACVSGVLFLRRQRVPVFLCARVIRGVFACSFETWRVSTVSVSLLLSVSRYTCIYLSIYLTMTCACMCRVGWVGGEVVLDLSSDIFSLWFAGLYTAMAGWLQGSQTNPCYLSGLICLAERSRDPSPQNLPQCTASATVAWQRLGDAWVERRSRWTALQPKRRMALVC